MSIGNLLGTSWERLFSRKLGFDSLPELETVGRNRDTGDSVRGGRGRIPGVTLGSIESRRGVSQEPSDHSESGSRLECGEESVKKCQKPTMPRGDDN